LDAAAWPSSDESCKIEWVSSRNESCKLNAGPVSLSNTKKDPEKVKEKVNHNNSTLQVYHHLTLKSYHNKTVAIGAEANDANDQTCERQTNEESQKCKKRKRCKNYDWKTKNRSKKEEKR
jgi:hypothetical protein